MTSAKTEQYNEDELQPPQWLDDSAFFTKVLKNSEKNANDIQVKNYKISPATVKGDHYGSVMFRATVDYITDNVKKSKSMIIKTMPSNEGFKKEMLEKYGIFEVEIGMYTKVLPQFEKYLRKICDDTKLMAPVLYHSLSPYKLIVFEDLVPLGYDVLRDRTANEEEVKAAYTKLAKWHAISHVILNKNPHYFDEYRDNFFTQADVRENPLFGASVSTFMHMMRKMPELKKYLPKLEKLVEKVDLLDETVNSFTEYRKAPRNDAYYVLNHGDYHVKNMMFKYNKDNGKLDDVMLVDFQFSHVGPITNDLIYSIIMAMDSDLRSRKTEMLHYYFDVFKATLQKIGFEGESPNYAKFQEQVMRHKYYELFLVMTFLPICPKFFRGEASIDTIISDPEYRRKIYEDKEFIDELLIILPKYLELGYLDAK
ncbi:uncharacterized protein [Eurosta solidaginis]|uniref:uncharacterized protein n=1 Tax=Eurosta solidaginis TaxID=178769 RepID=UPI003531299E